ncbi:MAG: organomercurial lyase [Planctomycetota bacterium]
MADNNTGNDVGRKPGMGTVGKIIIVAAVVVGVGLAFWMRGRCGPASCPAPAPVAAAPDPAPKAALPRLVDLGAGKCIPCKLMAPILEELKRDYAGRFQVEFIDVWVNPGAGESYKIKLIPTQIFFDASGRERFRHEGFFSKGDILVKWKELGVDVAAEALPGIERWEPIGKDERTRDRICSMCGGDVNLKTLVVVRTDKGDVRLCSPHCYFILYSCLTEDKTGFEKKVFVTDYATGNFLAAPEAVFLHGLDEKSGRPVVRAFAGRDAATKEMQAAGGNIVAWNVLQEKELSHRCGFCDRACYPQDAAAVTCGGVHSWGCCSHCALGVAARTGKDIEVRERDRLTGDPIVVKTLGGKVASLEPATAVAWFGQKKTAEGKWVSAGCFHQGFFMSPENLRKWLDGHPLETGKMISIAQALEDKMKLTPQQIGKACKIGECKP